jgi:hypothetical protein
MSIVRGQTPPPAGQTGSLLFNPQRKRISALRVTARAVRRVPRSQRPGHGVQLRSRRGPVGRGHGYRRRYTYLVHDRTASTPFTATLHVSRYPLCGDVPARRKSPAHQMHVFKTPGASSAGPTVSRRARPGQSARGAQPSSAAASAGVVRPIAAKTFTTDRPLAGKDR